MASNWLELLSGKKLNKVTRMGQDVVRNAQAKSNKTSYYIPQGFMKGIDNNTGELATKWLPSQNKLDKVRLKKLERLHNKTEKATTKARVGAGAALASGGAIGGAYYKNKKDSENKISKDKARQIYIAGQRDAAQKFNKEASTKNKAIDFFKRLGDLYSGKTAKRVKKVRDATGESLNKAHKNNADQSVVDNLLKRYDKSRGAYAGEQMKRSLLYGTTGVAGVTSYQSLNKEEDG